MPLTRRHFLAATAAATALATLPFARSAFAASLLHRPIPSTGETLPAIGVGTARRYAAAATAEERAVLRDTLARFAALGGRMVDTAPSYGDAEAIVGALVEELGIRERLFLATKVSSTGLEAGMAQIEQSFRRLRTDTIDLLYVHNLQDVRAQLRTLRDLKQNGRVRHIGATTSRTAQHAPMATLIAREPMDLVQVDFAIDNRAAAATVLPAAQEHGVGVVVNLPFGRNRLFDAVRGQAVPDWAQAELGIDSWAQFFLKYILGHSAVTCVIPGMAKVAYVEDNLAAATGPMPDAAQLRRMEALVDAL